MAALLLASCGQSLEESSSKATDTSLSHSERCLAMLQMADEGAEAVDPLHGLATDKDFKTARCAIRALGNIHGPAAVDALASLLSRRNPDVVLLAVRQLSRPGAADAARPMTAVLDSPQRTVVLAAIDALRAMGDQRAVPALERLALHRETAPAVDRAETGVRLRAVQAIGELGTPAAKESLVQVMHTDPGNARVAGYALARIFRKDVRPLLPLLQDSQNRPLAYALVDVGQKGTEDALVQALMSYGDLSLAEYYLNCGSGKLEDAAHDWAYAHGYTVTTTYGAGGGQWGSGL